MQRGRDDYWGVMAILIGLTLLLAAANWLR